MFSYTISKEADRGEFKQTCELLENALNDIQKEKLLEDVDGSMIQYYSADGAEIRVYNDYEVDAVYVDSQINLDGVIENPVISYQGNKCE